MFEHLDLELSDTELSATHNGYRIAFIGFEEFLINNETYYRVKIVSTYIRYQGYGIMTKLYQYLLDNLPEHIAGICGDSETWVDKRKIQHIYEKLGATILHDRYYLLKTR